MSYNSLEEIVRECQEKDLPFDEVILLDDMNERNVSREESIETMRGMWEAMKGAERNYDGSLQSRSGLVGGAGKTMRAYVESGNTLCGPFVGKVMASAQYGRENGGKDEKTAEEELLDLIGVLFYNEMFRRRSRRKHYYNLWL